MSGHQHRGPRLHAFMICERCYYECQKPLTKYPDHRCQHIESPQILATLHRSQLVQVRPVHTHMMDNLASRNMWFGLCVHDSRCRGAECTFAHSIAERDYWNTELANRRCHRVLPHECALHQRHTGRALNTSIPPQVSLGLLQ